MPEKVEFCRTRLSTGEWSAWIMVRSHPVPANYQVRRAVLVPEGREAEEALVNLVALAMFNCTPEATGPAARGCREQVREGLVAAGLIGEGDDSDGC